MKLVILTPAEVLYEGTVQSVTLPGTVSPFTVLDGHAPIITSLEAGKLVCKDTNGTHEYSVNGGFAEVENNTVTVCIE